MAGTLTGKTDLSIMIGGPAGYGIAQAGALFSKACTRSGYFVFVNNEYPSLIRGGHNTVRMRVQDAPSLGISDSLDIVLALDRNGVIEHLDELSDDAIIVYDSDEVKEEDAKKAVGKTLVPMPLITIAREVGGEKIMKNTVGLGALCAITGLGLGELNQLIKESFGEKKAEISEINIKAARLGYETAIGKFSGTLGEKKSVLGKIDLPEKRLLVSGNEAIALGAMRAGCRLLCAYPMTPASAIMHYYAANEKEAGVVMKHVEDEISGITMAIGGAYAGARTMVSTSGGGFSLQTEGLGLAAITETPLVVIEVQRPGPATGLPTRTGQADLHFVINAHQDEFPRVVLSPGDANEAFTLAFDAFNWAERFQIPAIVLSDKYLAESQFTEAPFAHKHLKIDRGFIVDSEWIEKNKPFRRYLASAENGVSPRVLPGTPGGIHREPSDEKDEFGNIDESPNARKLQVEKRARKFEAIRREIPAPNIYGKSAGAEVSFVGWGSTKGALIEAIGRLREAGVEACAIHFTHVWPFPEKAEELLRAQKKLVLVEANSTAQLGKLIMQETGIRIKDKILRYDGRPLSAGDVFEGFSKISSKGGKI